MSARLSKGPRPIVAVTDEDRKLLERNLKEILGHDHMPGGSIGKLFTDYKDEVDALLDAFRSMSASADGGHRQWRRRTLAQLPPGVWTTEAAAEEVREGTLGFLSLDGEVGADGLKAYRLRCRVSRFLQSCLPATLEQTYAPLLAWTDAGTRQPLAGDTRIGMSTYALDHLFDQVIGNLQAGVREQLNLGDGPFPRQAVVACADMATQILWDGLAQAAEGGKTPEAEDSLAVRLAANLSANRALIERKCSAQLAIQATPLASKLLALLAKAGIHAVPKEMDTTVTSHEIEFALEGWLTRALGPGGRLLGLHEQPIRAMSAVEVAAAVHLSGNLHEKLLAKESMVYGPPKAKELYDWSQYRFIILLAIVAAYIHVPQLQNEFTGHKNPTHAVFPGRGKPETQETFDVSIHGRFLIQSIITAIFETITTNWCFDASQLPVHLDARLIRLERQQRLYVHMIKGRSASELLAIDEWFNGQNASP